MLFWPRGTRSVSRAIGNSAKFISSLPGGAAARSGPVGPSEAGIMRVPSPASPEEQQHRKHNRPGPRALLLFYSFLSLRVAKNRPLRGKDLGKISCPEAHTF